MLKHKNSTARQNSDNPASPIATIINQQTEVPIACDQCDAESLYTLGHLKQLPQITCKHCSDSRTFSELEMAILEQALKQMGLYLAG